MSPNPPNTVLVVEDDAGIAELEQMQLENAGFSVLTAATAEEALGHLHRATVALVLLDYRLTGNIDGLEFHAQMKAAGFDLLVILVTGFSNETLAIRALRSGVRDFVTKSPESLDYLPEAVHRVLKQVDTEHQLAESQARLTAERNLLRTLIDALPDVVFTKDIDLLLTDVVMRRLGGRELAETLRPRSPRMKVLYMSGYTDDAMVRHGLAQEQVPFLQKPVTPSKLASKVPSVRGSAG